MFGELSLFHLNHNVVIVSIWVQYHLKAYLKVNFVLNTACPWRPVPCLMKRWLWSPCNGALYTSNTSFPKCSDMLQKKKIVPISAQSKTVELFPSLTIGLCRFPKIHRLISSDKTIFSISHYWPCFHAWVPASVLSLELLNLPDLSNQTNSSPMFPLSSCI